MRGSGNNLGNGGALGGRLRLEEMSVVFQSTSGEDVHAVRDFSLKTESGEFVCIVGPSGCGKSTVLNVIAGFVDCTSGEVLLDGEPILLPNPERGVVFQEHALFPWKSVAANVEFGLKMQGVGKTERQRVAEEYIQQVGLTGFKSKYPHELSGGMAQRVGIARVLASNPGVMLMDEPFGSLDAQTRGRMQELLLDIWEKYKKTIVFVTHDLDEAIFLSDKIALMTASPGTVKQVFNNSLPRPRMPDIYTAEAFLELKVEMMTMLRKEMEEAQVKWKMQITDSNPGSSA
jgi:NitT/TauT family transport system ATP-binding protein